MDTGNAPFVIFCDSEIRYDGRASSHLDRGNYLIVGKADGSLMVHGATLTQPRNYMGSGSTIVIEDQIGISITAKRKSETLCITVYKIHNAFTPDGWSDMKIKLTRTEKELTDKIANTPFQYLGIQAEKHDVYREHPTPAGPVDLVITTPGNIFIIEVKRKKITLTNCYQLKRYLDAYVEPTPIDSFAFSNKVIGCLAGPDISSGAKKHCDDVGYRYIQVDFTEVPLKPDAPAH